MSNRLYLLKDGKKDIYIDFNQTLPQHQIDGIRFLYKQFKKKKPGVILNDPSGYGKCLQSTLLLQGLRNTLNKPIIIICNEYNIDNWKEHFEKWTDFDDVAINTANAFSKNMVFINTPDNIATFGRRNFSILIVQDSTFSKDILHTSLKADFKIWITSIDMKGNLNLFSVIYQWLDINNKFNVADFTAKKNNVKDEITKSLLLDAFMEEVVIRRKDFTTPFIKKNNTPKKQNEMNIKETPPKSRKNKDPTGLKVKKSRKRIIDDDEDTSPVVNKKNSTIFNEVTHCNYGESNEFNVGNYTHNDASEHNKKDNDKCNYSKNELDVESFIRDQEPINSNEFKDLISDIDIHKTNNKIPKSNGSNNTLYNFENAINEIISNENKATEEVPSQAIDDNNEIITKCEKENLEESNDSQNSFSIMNTDSKEDVIKEENEINNSIFAEKVNINAIEDEGATHKVEACKDPNDANSHKEHKLKEVKEKSVSSNEENGETNTETNTAVKSMDVEDQLLELEKKLLKKFKGSLLDSIF